MPLRVSCPYCNTSFALPAAPPDGRAACPRCGDTFTVRADQTEVIDDAPQEIAPPVVSAPPPPRRPRTGRLIAVAGLLVLVGFGVGYVRNELRPRPDPEPDAPPSVVAVAPLDLSGLAYLPPDTRLIAGVQFGPILGYAARTNQDANQLLARDGFPVAMLANAGLTLQQIDHVVAGTNARELRFTLVLVLRRPPDDEEQFLRGFQAQPDRRGQKDRYEAALGGKFPVQMARASPRVWVTGVNDKDFAGVERGGYGAGGGHLSADLREMLGQKLPPDAVAWAAADTDAWADNPVLRLGAGFDANLKAVLPVLAKGKAAVAGLSFGDPPRLRVFARGIDEATGEQVRAYFRRTATAEGARTGGAGEWAMYDAPYDPRDGLRPLRTMLDDAQK